MHNGMIKESETHPLPPFLPSNARILLLGSFPPQRKRWSMDFFYPNMQNDMWRIFGLYFFDDKEYFVDLANKCFRKQLIIDFLSEKGIAIYDTATSVRRLKDNASDKFLEVVEPTNISLLLGHLPQCHAIVTTGEKATQTLCEQFNIPTPPPVGEGVSFKAEDGRFMQLYRMPSSSRAYPLPIEKKTLLYSTIFKIVEN